MAEFHPFEYVVQNPQRSNLGDKLEKLTDAVQILIINVLKVAEFYNTKLATISTSLNQIESRIAVIENPKNSENKVLDRLKEDHQINLISKILCKITSRMM